VESSQLTKVQTSTPRLLSNGDNGLLALGMESIAETAGITMTLLGRQRDRWSQL